MDVQLRRQSALNGRMAVHQSHYPALDYLRMLAALIVLVFHVTQIFGLAKYEPPYAFLAVDFFFVLSGFVVARAYDDRLHADLTAGAFARKRVIRLYPAMLAGVLLGLIAFTLSVIDGGKHGVLWALAMGAPAALLIPSGFLGHLQAYPADNPVWSLAFEGAANAAYVTRLGRLRGRALALALAISAAALTLVAWHFKTMLLVGFQTRILWTCGLVRVAFPFLAGIALWRFNLAQRARKVPLLLPVALLALVLLQPRYLAWPYEVLAIVVVFPAIVWLGIGASAPSKKPKVSKWCGDWSYTLYVLHVPIVSFVHSKFEHAPTLIGPTLVVTAVATLGVSAAAVIPDRVIRRRLEGRFLASKQPHGQT